MPHEECVNLIKRAGDTLALKVVTANIPSMTQSHYQQQDLHSNQLNNSSHSLPYRRKGWILVLFLNYNFIYLFILKAPIRGEDLDQELNGMLNKIK